MEFETTELAQKAVKKLQNFMLNEHALKLSMSIKQVSKTENEKKNEKVLKKRKNQA